MLDDNRYCGDILIQLAAAQNALRNVGYIILEEHMRPVSPKGIKNGDDEVIAEAVELLKSSNNRSETDGKNLMLPA